MESSSPAKKKSGTIIIAIAAILIMGALVAAFVLMGEDGGEDGDEDLKLGDFIKYEYTTTSGNATMWMNVTGVNETGYEFTVTLIHDDGYIENPDPWFIERSSTIFWGQVPDDSWLDDYVVEVEDLMTDLGNRSVLHYRNVTDDADTDVYIGEDTHIVYRIAIETGSSSMTMELVETNISWV